MIKTNIDNINKKIKNACERAGRQPSEITLVAVTKTASIIQVKEAVDCGLQDFGENRIQMAQEKIAILGSIEGLRWHMIGHLQTNKVAKAVELFDLIHGVDSIRLAEEINKKAKAKGVVFPVLLEVNVSGEESKFGVRTEEVKSLIAQTDMLENIDVKGLMTMAPFSDDPEDSRPYFKKMALLKTDLGLQYLSMGMTQDFEVAIEEGSNIVRIGRGIFDG